MLLLMFAKRKFPKVHLLLEISIYIVFLVILVGQGWNRALYHGNLIWGDDFQWQSWLYRISYGEIPYRDFFVLYGPLLPFVFYLPFVVLGGNFWAWNVIAYVFLPLFSFWAAILISRLFLKTVLFRIIFLIIASTFDAWGLFFLQPWQFRFWLGLFLMVILFSRLKRRFFWAGVWTAVVFFSSIDQGMYLLGSLGVLGILGGLGGLALLRPFGFAQGYGGQGSRSFKLLKILKSEFKEKIWELGKGIGVAAFPMVVVLAVSGALENYISFSFFTLPSKEVSDFGIAFPEVPFDLLKSDLFYFLYSKQSRFWWPIIVYLVSLIWHLKELFLRKKFLGPSLFLTIYGIFSFRTVLVRSDFEHLAMASIPYVILAVWFLEQALMTISAALRPFDYTRGKQAQGKFEKNALLLGVKVSLLVFFLGGGLWFFYITRSGVEAGFLSVLAPSYFNLREHWGLVYSPLLGVYADSDRVESLEKVVTFLGQTKEKFYTHGWLQGLYFLTKTKNPTYFDQDFWANKEEQKKIIKTLEEKKINLMLSTPSHPLVKESVLDNYFSKYYQKEKEFGEIVLWRRFQGIDDSL